jgi:hypothetical protein
VTSGGLVPEDSRQTFSRVQFVGFAQIFCRIPQLGFPRWGSKMKMTVRPLQDSKGLMRLKHRCLNSQVVDSTRHFQFGTRGSEVQILSPRPIFSITYKSWTRPSFLVPGRLLAEMRVILAVVRNRHIQDRTIYLARPTRRTRSSKRGSERNGSRRGSTLR